MSETTASTDCDPERDRIEHHSHSCVSRLADLRGIREFVRDVCLRRLTPPLPESSIAELELAVQEAASNIMRHAYAGAEDGEILVEADVFADRVAIHLRHRGLEFSPDPTAIALDEPSEGGMGLYIIDQSVDEAAYSSDLDGGRRICLVKRRRPKEERDGTRG